MHGTTELIFDRKKIRYPRIGTPPEDSRAFDDWVEKAMARLNKSRHPLAGIRISLRNGTRNSLVVGRHKVVYTCGLTSFDERGNLRPPKMFSPEFAALADEARLAMFVAVPPGEGYERGIHVFDAEGASARALVVFDPCEKTGIARYRIDAWGKTFESLSSLVNGILTGRVPEVKHSHRLPCA